LTVTIRPRKIPRTVLTAGAVIAAGLAAAQTAGPYVPPSPTPSASPYAGAPSYTPPTVSTPQTAYSQGLSQSDAQNLQAALAAAKSAEGGQIRAAMGAIYDPLARKIALWALVDAAPTSLSYLEADNARRDLAGWPRADKREMVAETLLGNSGMGPAATIAWFAGAKPTTAQGALALATALNASGQVSEAAALIRGAWRTMVCDQVTQEAILARFGAVLASADHTAREDMLLYGAQGTTAGDMLRLLPPDQLALAGARMAVRRGDPSAQSLIDALPPALRNAPGLAYERILSFRDHGDTSSALSLIGYLPQSLPSEDAAERLWKHGNLATAALRAGNISGAYAAAAHSGLSSGADAAEAEFEAGWIALVRMKDARAADEHFARLQTIGGSPLTQSRALYWRGRTAEAMGDPVAAQLFYAQGARYQTTFYGQLAASKGGPATITLGHDPEITAADRARFEGRESVRAARLLAQIGAKDAFKTFVTGISETLPTGAEEALLVDFVRGWGDQELAMRVVRNAARRDFILPERGYPIRSAPAAYDAPEAPFVLGIVRQESSFNPMARSGAGARGMMQLMPGTAQGVARRLGAGDGDLDDPDYNMRLGSAYLGQLVGQFSGSYVMAAAAYNAGPGRPSQWSVECGDPRSSSTDPVNFIECIPFSETRDYVMRVLEATQVYRARLGGGTAPDTLANDLKRGAYGYASSGPATSAGGGAT
jgi:soluble lytic murein transglycosylase